LASPVDSTADTSSLPNYSQPLRARVNVEEPDVAHGEDYYTYRIREKDEPQLDLSNKTGDIK
jgi:hypothetical protein